MKTYKCPDCGKTWENEAPQTCTECGCPSHKFEIHESTPENDVIPKNNIITEYDSIPEKVYFQNDSVRITDKLWSFDATMESDDPSDDPMVGGVHFPVKSISSVGYFSYVSAVRWLISGAILMLIGFLIFLFEFWAGAGTSLLISGSILFIVGLILITKRDLKVFAHNPDSNFTIKYMSRDEGNKILNAMLQCLKENT